MAEKVKNQIIVLEPCIKSVTDLLAMVKEKTAAEIVMAKTAEDAIGEISGVLPCLLIVSLADNAAVPAGVQLLKRLESTIKNQGLKVYMVTGIKNQQLADLFTQKMGVTDYIIDPVPVRTMLFKVNLALKAVENFRKQRELKRAQQEQIVIKKFEGKKNEAAASSDVATKGKPALQMAEDTFLFKNGSAKKAGKKFVVEVEGPDPSTGEWQQHEDKGDAKTAWRWVPNEEKAAQASGSAPKDGWVHEGDKPSFNEESGKWALSSETPALALKQAGKTVAEKISLDEKGELVVAEDSPAAAENLQKNRVKAAEAIKQREEKQKILAEKKKAADKVTLAEAKDNVLAGLEGDEEKKLAASKAAPEALDKLKKNKKDNSAALQDLMNSVESDESDEPSEFNNKLDGKKEQLRSVVDKRDDRQLKAAKDTEAGEEKAEEQSGDAEKKASPLDFLKKKKEQMQQASLASNVNQIKAGPPLKGVNALKESEDEEGPSAGILNRKKSSKSKLSAVDKLARLKAGLAVDPEEEEEEEILSGEEENADAPPTSFGGKSEKSDKKGGTPSLKLKNNEEPDKKGTPRLKLLEKRKKAKAALEEKLLEPIPEEMTPEEELEIRKELGLEGRPEIKVKELARKKRQAEVDRMNDLLAEIDEEMNQEEGEVISVEQGSDEDSSGVKRRGDLSAEKLKGIRAALDSEEEEEEESEENKKLSRSEKEAATKKSSLIDEANYIPEADLLPLGNAWESTESHFAYLNASVRYKEFDKLEDVLPLWIFKGDTIPELLDKTKQWRFRGPLPTQAKTVTEIPSDVRDFLLGIRDQIKANAESEAEAEEDSSETASSKKKDKNKPSAESALDRLKAQLAESDDGDEESENSDLSTAEEEEDSLSRSSKGKFKAGGELTLPGEELNDLKAKKRKSNPEASEDEDAEETPENESAEEGDARKKGALGKKGKKSSGAAGMDALARLREKMGEDESEAELEEEIDSGKKRKTAASLDEKEETDRNSSDAEEETPKDRMERLRAQLDMEEDSGSKLEAVKAKKKKREPGATDEEEVTDETSAELDADEEKPAAAKKSSNAMDRLREKLGMSENSEEENSEEEADQGDNSKDAAAISNQEDAASTSDEQEVTEPKAIVHKAAASEAVKKFIERRKNKKAKVAAPPSENPAKKAASAYLGIYVSLSDSLAQEKESDIAVPRVLKAFEESFGDCAALCTGLPDAENFASVTYCAPTSPDALSRVQLNSGIFEAITSGDGGKDDLLGYLFLQAKGARAVFSDEERTTIQKIARKLWPLLKRDHQESEAA